MYKFRKTGDLIGTILESSDKENTTLPHVQLAYSGYSGMCNISRSKKSVDSVAMIIPYKAINRIFAALLDIIAIRRVTLRQRSVCEV